MVFLRAIFGAYCVHRTPTRERAVVTHVEREVALRARDGGSARYLRGGEERTAGNEEVSRGDPRGVVGNRTCERGSVYNEAQNRLILDEGIARIVPRNDDAARQSRDDRADRVTVGRAECVALDNSRSSRHGQDVSRVVRGEETRLREISGHRPPGWTQRRFLGKKWSHHRNEPGTIERNRPFDDLRRDAPGGERQQGADYYGASDEIHLG